MQNRPSYDRAIPGPTTDQLKKIIQDDNTAALLVETANGLGEALARPLSSSQIRAIYSEVLRIKADWLQSHDAETKKRAQRAFILLRPKMAYRKKKEGGAVGQLVDVLDSAILLVNNDDGNFRRFYEFFEAILAYHKAYGGK